MDGQYYKIIKYNTNRQYFGNWSPRALHEAFEKVREEPEFSRSIYVGRISMDLICDTLYNEMSYNPLRFGLVSPFVKNNKNNIHNFIKTQSQSNDETMKKIAGALAGFRCFAYEYDNNVNTNGFVSDSDIEISVCDNVRANCGYMMLACLTRALHTIASQNMNDFNKSKKFRETIKSVIKRRHPNLIRPYKNTSIVRPVDAKEERISEQIRDLSYDIRETQMRIDNLSEYENPSADIEHEKSILQEQQKQLELFEERLARIQQNSIHTHQK